MTDALMIVGKGVAAGKGVTLCKWIGNECCGTWKLLHSKLRRQIKQDLSVQVATARYEVASTPQATSRGWATHPLGALHPQQA